MSLSDVISTALGQIQHIAKTETVVGDPITVGGVTLIPVSRISVGFAAGGGGKDEKSGNGAGTGGGITITPIAFISVSDGRVHVHAVSPSDPILNQVLAMAPDAVKKISQLFGKKNDDKGKE
jgi:uncharacterized spore protein YtfJ